MRSLNIAATGMMAQQTNVDVISQNLANMTTTGYKRQRAEFQDLLYQNFKRVGANSSDVGTIVPTGIQMGVGVKTGAVSRNTEQGTVTNTENPLDIAIQGRGYFQVELPNGEIVYTRDGTFKLSPDGELVTIDGYIVSPGIVIPQEAVGVSINAFGEVQVTLDNQVDPVDVGQLEMATFVNPAGLDALGNNLFRQTAASGDPVAGFAGDEGFGTMLQGFVEASNVNPISEITLLIVAQRAYEMNSKVITSSDQMLNALNQSA
jgi:flagellar basal-body rod protein FlgG